MEIKNYYENLLNNNNLEKINKDIYFDFEGEGYSLAEFSAINPLINADNLTIILSHFNDEFGFAFYRYNKNGKLFKAMDIIMKKDGQFTDHYLCHSIVNDASELTIENRPNKEYTDEQTIDFMKRFWDGEDVKYSDNYREHSTFLSEVMYENIIEIHSVNNYIFMLCDGKIDGLYGTIGDLYVIEDDKFLEHWDVFTVDKVQPAEPELTC